MWGFRQWAQVVDHLHKRWGATVIVTGTATERWLAERITRHAHHAPLNACGRTSLTELAALVDGADLMVAVNSGPAAMAVATGTPVVILNALYYEFEESLWGAHPGDNVVTDLVVRDNGAHRWYGDCRARKLRGERHCVNPACIGQGVMGTISPEMVIQAIDERLAAWGQREEAGDGGGDDADGNGWVHRPGTLPDAGGGAGVRPGAVPVAGGAAAPLA
jgi:hypothetical protein